jgi:hypothetical protein
MLLPEVNEDDGRRVHVEERLLSVLAHYSVGIVDRSALSPSLSGRVSAATDAVYGVV